MIKDGSKILVVRLSSLGDILLTFPLLENLKKAHPGCKITFLVKGAYRDLLKNNPHLDRLWVFEEKGFWGTLSAIRGQSFDVYVDLHGTARSRLWGVLSGISTRLRYRKRAWERRLLVWFKKKSAALDSRVVDRYLDVLKDLDVPVLSRLPRIRPSTSADQAKYWKSELGDHLLIGVAPGALHATKRWPGRRFAEACDELAQRLSQLQSLKKEGPSSCRVILLGAPGDQEAAQEVLAHLQTPARSFVGKTNISSLIDLLSRCSLVLSNDSGAMHLAAALEIPTVAVFGPTVREFGFFPKEESCEVLENNKLSCRPCSLHGGEICPQKHFDCMLGIGVESVVEGALRALAHSKRTRADRDRARQVLS